MLGNRVDDDVELWQIILDQLVQFFRGSLHGIVAQLSDAGRVVVL
jgi:hypothetical protein